MDPDLNKTRCEPIAVGLWSDLGIREKFLAHQGLWPKQRRELFRRRMACGMAGTGTASHPDPQCAADLLAEAMPPPVPVVDNLMHEGTSLLGGKSERGKSWLMLDLALAVSTGWPVWGHFAVSQAQPVLYLALEDGRARVQRQLRAIQSDIKAADNLHLRDKDAEDRALHVALVDGHWENVGDAEELKVSRERKAIYEALRDENRPLSPAEVGKLLSAPQKGYEAVRKYMQRMANEGQIMRADRGRYLAPQDASQGEFELR